MDKYQIQREIGCGNFAKVYLAINIHTEEKVSCCKLASQVTDLSITNCIFLCRSP